MASHGKLGILSKATAGHMKYRVARAHWLLGDKTEGGPQSNSSFMGIVAEESSDDEGGFPITSTQTCVRCKCLFIIVILFVFHYLLN